MIERFDKVRVHERIHLGADVAGMRGRAAKGFAADHAQKSPAQAERRHLDLGPRNRLRVAGDHVEEGGDVVGQIIVAREVADVGIGQRRPFVVVAGRRMHIAFDPLALASDHQAHLGMRF